DDTLKVLLGFFDQDVHVFGRANEAVQNHRACADDEILRTFRVEQGADTKERILIGISHATIATDLVEPSATLRNQHETGTCGESPSAADMGSRERVPFPECEHDADTLLVSSAAHV